jgi:hypothetical protein
MSQSTTGERVTAAISTVVAIAILGAAVTAQQARTPIADRLASLESDLRFQFDLVFRDDHGALQGRLGELELTLDAWQKSPQSSDDVQLLIDWLRTSIERTMPGHSGELPPLPPFGRQRPSIVATTSPRFAAPPDAKPTPALAPREAATVIAGAELPAEEPAIEIAPVPTTPTTPARSSADPPTPTMPPEHPATVQPIAELAAAAIEAAPAPAPPAEPTRTGIAPRPPLGVNLNLAELNARIAGYHDWLAEIDAALIADDKPSARRLADLVGQLESLAGQYKFVRLYHDALTPAERRFVPAPRPMTETLALVDQRVAAATGDDFLEDFDAAHADKPTLAQRLHNVAKAVGLNADATR